MRWLNILSILLLSSLPFLHVQCSRTRTIDYDALEKSWEAGDDEDELRTEGDEQYRKLADRTEEEAKSLGPQMIFVTLKSGHSEPLADVASRWKEMLWNGGVEVNIYQVDDLKLLVGLQKGIFTKEVITFLNVQHDVKEYEWNGKAYLSERYRTDMKTIEREVKRPFSKRNKMADGEKMQSRRKSTESAKTIEKLLHDEL